MATILVVDDEPDIRFFVQLNLELDGHHVVTASNGTEAIAAIEAEPPDLVLLDVMMPEVDGWSVLERIKASDDTRVKETPVLMLTALSSDQDQVRGGIEGAVQYLTKPVSPDELRAAIDRALSGEPEPAQRRRAQTGALARLARIEKGTPLDEVRGAGAQPRLTKLEHERAASAAPPSRRAVDPNRVKALTTRQHELLVAVRAAPSVTAAASDLGMSRSNVYASLRRIGRRLDIATVPELLDRLRAGELDRPVEA